MNSKIKSEFKKKKRKRTLSINLIYKFFRIQEMFIKHLLIFRIQKLLQQSIYYFLEFKNCLTKQLLMSRILKSVKKKKKAISLARKQEVN